MQFRDLGVDRRGIDGGKDQRVVSRHQWSQRSRFKGDIAGIKASDGFKEGEGDGRCLTRKHAVLAGIDADPRSLHVDRVVVGIDGAAVAVACRIENAGIGEADGVGGVGDVDFRRERRRPGLAAVNRGNRAQGTVLNRKIVIGEAGDRLVEGDGDRGGFANDQRAVGDHDRGGGPERVDAQQLGAANAGIAGRIGVAGTHRDMQFRNLGVDCRGIGGGECSRVAVHRC